MSSLPLVGPVADTVRRTFRVILSGDPHGEPPWVTAIGRPGDAGWFGPGSAAWEVNGSLATLVGGIRALMLQACHPLALAGVEQHSSYRQDPLGRLQRTNLYVTTSTFGTTELAEQTAAMVRHVHQRVVGTAPDGRPYAAQDPRLLLWVHLALTDSMLVAHQRYGTGQADADDYVAEMGVLARALGVEEPPRTVVAMRAAFAGYRDELAGGPEAREVARFLRFPGRSLTIGAWPAYEVLARAASDLLPPWAHEVLGTRPRARAVQSVDTAVCRSVLAALHSVLGPRSRAVELAHERVGVDGVRSGES